MPQIPSYITLIIVILVARLFGMIFRKLGQPSVMGEVLGGIVLGPSVLGLFFPESTPVLFHPEALTLLGYVAEVGIILYLFILGLEVNLPRLFDSAKSAIIISQTSIFFPFLFGTILSLFIFDTYAPANVGFLEFALFSGVSLSITAFPVLARILDDSKMRGTRLGDLALTCAAINDIAAWSLVAILASLRSSNVGSHHLIGVLAFFAAIFLIFVFPKQTIALRNLAGRSQKYVVMLLLPAFFALTGVKTQIGLLTDSRDILICLTIVMVAIVGKFGGTFIGALYSGETKKDSTILGILMNTRGLVELIVLNIGLSIGVLSPKHFTMLVIMALVTTFMTGPLLLLVKPPR